MRIDQSLLPASVRPTVSAVLGGSGGLFENDGPVHSATLAIDDDADLPGGAGLLKPGLRVDAVVRLSSASAEHGVRTLCIKVGDAYGPGRDQDFLLASSADGIPFHHAALPAERVDSRLYFSLWLYLAGIEPIAFGASADRVSRGDGLSAGDQFSFLISSAVSRFRPVGELTIGDEITGATTTFSGRNAGGGLRALPPALFYQS